MITTQLVKEIQLLELGKKSDPIDTLTQWRIRLTTQAS